MKYKIKALFEIMFGLIMIIGLLIITFTKLVFILFLVPFYVLGIVILINGIAKLKNFNMDWLKIFNNNIFDVMSSLFMLFFVIELTLIIAQTIKTWDNSKIVQLLVVFFFWISFLVFFIINTKKIIQQKK